MWVTKTIKRLKQAGERIFGPADRIKDESHGDHNWNLCIHGSLTLFLWRDSFIYLSNDLEIVSKFLFSFIFISLWHKIHFTVAKKFAAFICFVITCFRKHQGIFSCSFFWSSGQCMSHFLLESIFRTSLSSISLGLYYIAAHFLFPVSILSHLKKKKIHFDVEHRK